MSIGTGCVDGDISVRSNKGISGEASRRFAADAGCSTTSNPDPYQPLRITEVHLGSARAVIKPPYSLAKPSRTDEFQRAMPESARENKIRLDELLVRRGLCPTRSQARALIMAGKVRRGEDEVLDKPGKTYPESTPLILESPPRFVGRGGEKLERFLDTFSLQVEGKAILDVGASTGGFTDCVLQRGAATVTCVDVGHGQLHAKLRADPRVTNLEKVNARNLTAEKLPRRSFDGIVMDLSFISLRLVLPAVWPLLEPGGWLVALVKPQFEAERKEVDRGSGVIRDEIVQQRIISGIRAFSLNALQDSVEIGAIDSPLRGADGNREFLLGLSKKPRGIKPPGS